MEKKSLESGEKIQEKEKTLEMHQQTHYDA